MCQMCMSGGVLYVDSNNSVMANMMSSLEKVALKMNF